VRSAGFDSLSVLLSQRCRTSYVIEERRNRQDIIEVHVRGYSSVALNEQMPITKVQEVTLVSLKRSGAQGILCGIFLNRVIDRWNELDQSAVDAPSISAFKRSLEKVRYNRMGFFMD